MCKWGPTPVVHCASQAVQHEQFTPGDKSHTDDDCLSFRLPAAIMRGQRGALTSTRCAAVPSVPTCDLFAIWPGHANLLSHMRPIGNYIAGTGRSIKVGANSGRSVSPSPSDNSRSSSPASSRRSPERRISSPSPPPSSTNSAASGTGGPEVVRKSIFGLDGPVMAGGSQRRRSSGPKRKAAKRG